MAKNNDSKQVASGFLWRFSERILAQVVTFVVSTVLARLLAPEHYGAISLVNVFITLANVFVSSGFGNALVQKKDANETDFSSVFYFNVTLSVVLYAIIFFCAPLVSELYEMPELTPVFRVMGLRLIVAAMNTIQHAYVSRHMLFRRFFWSTLGGTLISGVVGIVMAYYGFGIWALVAQYMVNTTIDTIVLFVTVKWRPRLTFSFSRLKGLLSYGWKLLASELVNTGYMELRSLVIGLKYSSADLAYYTKGQSFPKLLVVNVNNSIQSVLFPALAKAQDDMARLKDMTRRAIRINSYLMMPLVAGFALVAKPFVNLLLTERWLECVPYLQLYCLFYCFMPMQAANLQAIKALGRTDIYLKLEIIKKAVGVAMLLLSMPFGTLAIAASAVASNIFAVLISAAPNKKLFGYSFWEQLRDLFNGILPLAVMAAAVMLVGMLPMPDLLMIAVQIVSGAAVYILVSWVFKLDSFTYTLGLIRGFLKKRKK